MTRLPSPAPPSPPPCPARPRRQRSASATSSSTKEASAHSGLAAACALALLCGGLVSCQPVRQSFPTLVMDTQYYDSQGNYIEIPALAVPGDVEPDEGVTSINQALAELRGSMPPSSPSWRTGSFPPQAALSPPLKITACYPTQTERYLNLVLFRETFATD